jgi:hypothetical protein
VGGTFRVVKRRSSDTTAAYIGQEFYSMPPLASLPLMSTPQIEVTTQGVGTADDPQIGDAPPPASALPDLDDDEYVEVCVPPPHFPRVMAALTLRLASHEGQR